MAATDLPVQDYIYASELAYDDNPQARIGKMPGYGIIKQQTLGDGFQALVLQAKGYLLIAFRGTLTDVSGLLDRTMAVVNDSEVMAGASEAHAFVTPDMVQRLQADRTALRQDRLVQDIIADLQISGGRPVRQFTDAITLVKSYAKPGAKIYLTGHSLGGGIVEAVADAIPGMSGMTFAAPGDVKFRAGSAPDIVNYINVNDPVGMVNLPYHVGKIGFLDQHYTSFDIEHELDLPGMTLMGFNAVPDADAALTADPAHKTAIILGSLGFLVARLAVFHLVGNYAALLGCKDLGAQAAAKPKSLHDLAMVARHCIAASLFLVAGGTGAVLPYAAPVVVPFVVRTVRASYGQAELDAAQFGFAGMP
jgi:hypothetical protein